MPENFRPLSPKHFPAAPSSQHLAARQGWGAWSIRIFRYLFRRRINRALPRNVPASVRCCCLRRHAKAAPEAEGFRVYVPGEILTA